MGCYLWAVSYSNEQDLPKDLRVRECTYSQGGETCTRKLYATGLCKGHYLRKWRGLPLGSVKIREPHGRKLSDAQVLVIYRKVKSGVMSRKQAAEKFNVSYFTICDVMRGRRAVQQQDTAADS